MKTKVQIKGIRDSLLIILDGGPWEELREALFEQLGQQADFWQGARLALDVGGTAIKAAELGQLTKEVSEQGLTLWAILSESPTTERSAQSFGLATRLEKERFAGQAFNGEAETKIGEDATLIRKTLRSGFNLQYTGHVTVIGDVNPGAQVIAGGDVVIWGKLRGMVHAGAHGDETAVVCALDLSPTQLRIAGTIALTPKRRGKPQPEMAYLKDGVVIAETWDPKREKL